MIHFFCFIPQSLRAKLELMLVSKLAFSCKLHLHKDCLASIQNSIYTEIELRLCLAYHDNTKTPQVA